MVHERIRNAQDQDVNLLVTDEEKEKLVVLQNFIRKKFGALERTPSAVEKGEKGF